MALFAASVCAQADDPAHQGRFGSVFDWPLIPLHVTVLPDGRVLGFGANASGGQDTLSYAVWNPAMGTSPESMTKLANTTQTNIFCSGGGIIPARGDVLIVGGDRTINGVANYGISDFNIFRLASNFLERQSQRMAAKRWYPSVITLSDGDQLILGGRRSRDFTGDSTTPATAASYALTPERYSPSSGFRALAGARSARAFGGSDAQWNYPRGFLAPNGKIFLLGFGGGAWWLDPDGDGELKSMRLRWIGTEPR